MVPTVAEPLETHRDARHVGGRMFGRYRLLDLGQLTPQPANRLRVDLADA